MTVHDIEEARRRRNNKKADTNVPLNMFDLAARIRKQLLEDADKPTWDDYSKTIPKFPPDKDE